MTKSALVDCEERQERGERIGSTHIRIVSYRVGGRFHCAVADLNSGRIAETEGASRKGAESAAVSKAQKILMERLIKIPITTDDGLSRWEGEGGPAVSYERL